MARNLTRRKQAVVDSSSEQSSDEMSGRPVAAESSEEENVNVDESEEALMDVGEDEEEDADEDADEEEEDDDEDEDDDEEEEEDVYVSDGEEAYHLEDPEEMDEDLELHDELIDPSLNTPSQTKPDRQARAKPIASDSKRAPRKRNALLLEADTSIGDARSLVKKPRRAASTASGLDNDLLLTDEEQEYDPHANPDVMKMTERQRACFLSDESGTANEFARPHHDDKELLELGQGIGEGSKVQAKKETDEEAALRKSELARRRHDYKIKQLEEEKQDTLNKLLKRRATKTRESQTVPSSGSAETVNEMAGQSENGTLKPRRPLVRHEGMLRYTSKIEHGQYRCTLAVPTVYTV